MGGQDGSCLWCWFIRAQRSLTGPHLPIPASWCWNPSKLPRTADRGCRGSWSCTFPVLVWRRTMLPQCPQRHPQEREGLPYHGHQRREDGTCGGPHWSGGTPEPSSSTAGSRGQGPPGLSGCAETLSPPCRSPHSPDGQDGSALVPPKLFLLLQMNSVRESICLDLALRPCPGWVSRSRVR